MKDGTYPLSRPLFFYLRNKASADIKAFVDWVLSPAGQEHRRARSATTRSSSRSLVLRHRFVTRPVTTRTRPGGLVRACRARMMRCPCRWRTWPAAGAVARAGRTQTRGDASRAPGAGGAAPLAQTGRGPAQGPRLLRDRRGPADLHLRDPRGPPVALQPRGPRGGHAAQDVDGHPMAGLRRAATTSGSRSRTSRSSACGRSSSEPSRSPSCRCSSPCPLGVGAALFVSQYASRAGSRDREADRRAPGGDSVGRPRLLRADRDGDAGCRTRSGFESA